MRSVKSGKSRSKSKTKKVKKAEPDPAMLSRISNLERRQKEIIRTVNASQNFRKSGGSGSSRNRRVISPKTQETKQSSMKQINLTVSAIQNEASKTKESFH